MKRKRLETLKCSTADDPRKPYSTSAAKSLTPLENSGGPLDNTHDTRAEGNISSQVSSSEYPFLRFSPSGSLGKEEIEYLEHRGCFRIPAQPALDVFLRMYFIHVHPYSPVLIEADFWRIYRHGPSAHERSMSLFVFQALLFVCSAVRCLEYLRALGSADHFSTLN